jgi:hypothetical protein
VNNDFFSAYECIKMTGRPALGIRHARMSIEGGGPSARAEAPAAFP